MTVVQRRLEAGVCRQSDPPFVTFHFTQSDWEKAGISASFQPSQGASGDDAVRCHYELESSFDLHLTPIAGSVHVRPPRGVDLHSQSESWQLSAQPTHCLMDLGTRQPRLRFPLRPQGNLEIICRHDRPQLNLCADRGAGWTDNGHPRERVLLPSLSQGRA